MKKINTEHQHTSDSRQQRPTVDQRIREAERTLDGVKKRIDKETDLSKKETERKKEEKILMNQVDTVVSKLEQELQSNAQIGSGQQEISDQANISTRAMLYAVQNELIQPPKNSKIVLQKLADMSLADTTAAYLAPFINKYIEEDIIFSKDGEEKTTFEKDMESLNSQNPIVAKILKSCLIAYASELGSTEDIMKDKFKKMEEAMQESQERRVRRDGPGESLEQDWHPFGFDNLFSESDKPVLKALYSVDDALKFFTSTRDNVSTSIRSDKNKQLIEGMSEDKIAILIDQQTSNMIEEKILLVFDKIIKQIDEQKASEQAENILQKNVAQYGVSIGSVKFRLQMTFMALRGKLKDSDERTAGLKFYNKYSVEVFGLKKLLIDGKEVDVPQTRVIPTADIKECALGEFLKMVNTRIEEQFNIRFYLHNSRYIDQMPAGEHGFWSQVSGFAEKMKAVDIDTIMLLPDSDIFMAAYRLYIKYLQVTAARQDWKHTSIMFSPQSGKYFTEIEEEVKNAIDMRFRDTFKQEGCDWRLDRAISIASGLAKGVFMGELELGVSMDPPIDQKGEKAKGEVTAQGYSTHDSQKYSALSVLHTIMRFQPEALWIAVFAATEGERQPMTRWWKSEEIYKRMQEFQDSYMKGKGAFSNKEMELMIDFLPNMGNVGSIESRSGWRHYFAYEGWLQYEDTILREKPKLDYLKSWKAIENIGYSTLLHFSSIILEDESILGIQSDEDKKHFKHVSEDNEKLFNPRTLEEKKESEAFFQYLYKLYIDFPQDDYLKGRLHQMYEEPLVNRSEDELVIGEGFNVEISRLKSNEKLIKKIDKDIRKGKIDRKDRDKEIAKSAYKKFMYKVLAGYLRKTSPTKFITLERSKTSTDGTRAWQRLYDDLSGAGRRHIINAEIVKNIDDEIQNGTIEKKDKDKEIENRINEAYKKFELKEEEKKWTDEKTFDETIKDLMVVEVCLRDEVTKKMKEYLQKTNKVNNKLSLCDFSTNDSSVNEESIKRVMEESLGLSKEDPRIARAVEAYKKMAEKYLVGAVFDDFANQIEHNAFKFKGIPGEDLERVFLTYRNVGQTVLPRATGDIAKVEKGVSEAFLELINSLKIVAAGEHNPKPLVEAIGKIQSTIASIHGQDESYKVAYKLANMVITYYKKDTAARNIFTRWFVMGKSHSVAALVGGKYRGIWEWNVRDIDHFITELERHQIVPHEAYDLKKVKDGKLDKSHALKYCGKLLRQENGATKAHIALEILDNYGPLVMFALLFEWLKDAWKEITGGKQQQYA